MLVSYRTFIIRTLCVFCAVVFTQFGALTGAAIAGDQDAAIQDECGPEEKPCVTTVVTLNKAGAVVGTETRTNPAPQPQARLRNNKIIWRFINASGVTLNYRFYAYKPKWYWPSANQAYVLPVNFRRNTTITCKPGEKVCYGAWVAGQPRFFYGAGITGRASCTDCCYTCSGVISKVYILR